MEYEKVIKKLSKYAKVGLVRYYAYFGIGPDFVVKKGREVFFIDTMVNQAKPKKHTKTSYKIAEEHGFKIMVLTLDVKIRVGKVNLVEL